MAKKQLPYYKIYPGDEEKDLAIGSLSLQEYGAYCRLRNYLASGEPYGYFMVNHRVNLVVNLPNILRTSEIVAQNIMLRLLELGILQKNASGIIYSERMVQQNELSQRRASGGVKGGNPKLLALKNKGDKVNDKVNLIVNLEVKQKREYEYEYENELEKGKGMQGENPPTPTPPPPEPWAPPPILASMPAAWHTPQFAEIWDEWKQYLYEQHSISVKPITEKRDLENLIVLSEYHPPAAIEIIKTSIGNRWKTLNKKNKQNDNTKPNNNNTQLTKPIPRRSAHDFLADPT